MADLLTNLKTACDVATGSGSRSRLSGCIEIRADGVRDFSLSPFSGMKQKHPSLIFTCLGKDNIRLLKDAINCRQFEFVTIDIPDVFNLSPSLRAMLNLAQLKRAKIILSYHNFQNTQGNIEKVYQKLYDLKPQVIKIVTYARNISDNFKILKFAGRVVKNRASKLIAFCMGEHGLISRILYKKFGLFMTYSSLEEGKELAEGQIPFWQMKKLYNADSLNPRTKVFGLLGYPIQHSFSPYLFNLFFRMKKSNAVYLPFSIKPEDFENDFARINSYLKPEGFSVTSPYKIRIMRLLDKTDKVSREIKAVNTIYREDNKLIGTNTDWLGAYKVIESIPERNYPEYAFVLGQGGVSRALVYTLQQLNIKTTVFAKHPANRQIQPWQKLAQFCSNSGEKAFLINATPVGMFPDSDKSPVDKHLLKKGMLVFDTIYNPIETKLLKLARQKGCKIIQGLQMFFYQAIEQLRIFKSVLYN
jgi:3-dehydroquinate dehydratase/shikimate dehydrogenase